MKHMILNKYPVEIVLVSCSACEYYRFGFWVPGRMLAVWEPIYLAENVPLIELLTKSLQSVKRGENVSLAYHHKRISAESSERMYLMHFI